MADIQLFMWHTPGQSFCFVYIQVSHYYYYILISEIDSILFYLYIYISTTMYVLSHFRLLCPLNSPGQNTGIGCHTLLQGDSPDSGTEPMSVTSPALAGSSLPLAPCWMEVHTCII